MKRRGPIISISGVAFIVDVESESFTQFYNPANRIPFEKIRKDADGYYLLYDKYASNIWTGNQEVYPVHVRKVTIPPIAQLDPVGLSEKYDIPLCEIQKW